MTTPYPEQDPNQRHDPYTAPDPYAAQQQYGGQQPYGAQQPQYAAQPQYGAQQPYGQQPYGAPVAAKRPGILTAAAVLGFIVGGFGIIAGISYMGLSGLGYNASLLTVLGVVQLVLSALYIWGGVVALGGKNTQIIVIASGLSIIVSVVIWLAYTFQPRSLVSLIIPILIISFVLNAQSRDWVRSRGGTTF